MNSKHLIIPAISSLLLSACTIPFINQASNNADSAKGSVEQSDTLKNCKYDQSICAYMVAQMNAFQSGLTMTSEVTDAQKTIHTKTVTKMDGQGNMQSTSYKGDKAVNDMIVVNKMMYLKDYADGQWLKMTSSEDESEAASNPFNIPQSVDELKNQLNADDMQVVYNKVGEESCGQYTCEIYESFEQANQISKSKMWIDTTMHLARKTQTTLPDGSITTLTYEYGPVSISEPSPVKELSMPSQPDIQNLMQQLPQNGEE